MGRDGSGVTEHAGKLRVSFQFNGKRCRETMDLKATAGNIRAAEKTLKQIREEIANGSFNYESHFPTSRKLERGDVPRPSGARGKTISQAIEDFLKTKESKSGNTRKLYRNAGEVWKGIFDAETVLSKLTPDLVETTLGTHQFASSKLKNDYLIVLRGACRLAHKADPSWINPMTGVENDKRQKAQVLPVTGIEMKKILEHMHKNYDERVHAYFVWMFETGERPEEAIAHEWGDVDWQAKTIHVCRGRTLGVTGPCKTYATRDIDLSDAALDALRVMKKYSFRARSPERIVFENPNLNRYWHDSRSQNDNYWKPTLEILGVRSRRAYNTRHTFASLRLTVGAVPAYISKQMGHESLQQLYRTYGKWIGDNKSEAERVKVLMQAASAALDAKLKNAT